MNDTQNDQPSQEKMMSLIEFVNYLFDFARDNRRSGLYIQREDGHYTKIEITTIDNKVVIIMDGVNMGYFEEMNSRGYKCSFH